MPFSDATGLDDLEEYDKVVVEACCGKGVDSIGFGGCRKMLLLPASNQQLVRTNNADPTFRYTLLWSNLSSFCFVLTNFRSVDDISRLFPERAEHPYLSKPQITWHGLGW
jgi:hypothetical protein